MYKTPQSASPGTSGTPSGNHPSKLNYGKSQPHILYLRCLRLNPNHTQEFHAVPETSNTSSRHLSGITNSTGWRHPTAPSPVLRLTIRTVHSRPIHWRFRYPGNAVRTVVVRLQGLRELTLPPEHVGLANQFEPRLRVQDDHR